MTTPRPAEAAHRAAGLEVARKSRSNLAAALFWMPRERREDMHAFYAFCRLVDDDADDPSLPPDEKHARLDRWLAALDAPQPGEHACMAALRNVMLRRQIERKLVAEIVEGLRMDVAPQGFADFDALKIYSHRVAGLVGVVSTRIFGCARRESIGYAETLGQALQLTNILRDVGDDWRNGGRIYLPRSDMASCGYTAEKLAGGVRDEAFLRLMALETDRARAFYARACAMLTPEDRRALFPARLMSAVYQRLLNKLEREGYPVFDEPLRLGWGDRLAALVGAMTDG